MILSYSKPILLFLSLVRNFEHFALKSPIRIEDLAEDKGYWKKVQNCSCSSVF